MRTGRKMSSIPPSRSIRADAVPLRLVATVWLPFSVAYFMSYGLRNINAVLAPELTRELALSAADLGLLTSVFYITFALVQLPFGVLLDRYGSRRVHATLLLVAAVGCALHATGTGFLQLAIGRGLMGIGVAVGLMSAAKAFTQWFPLSRVPLAINFILAFGGLGAVVAAGPVGWSLAYVSWRVVFGVAAALLVGSSLFLYFLTPERPTRSESWSQLAAGFGSIFASGSFWRLAMMMAIMSGTYTAVQALWIGPWLRDVAGLERPQVIAMLTGLAVASVAGYAAMGAISDWVIRRGTRALTLYKIQTAVAIVLFALIALIGGQGGSALWMAFFGMGSGGPLVLTMLARRFPAHLVGRVNTASNVLMFGLAFVFQWGIGMVLDQWPVVDGRYAPEGYQAAFLALLALQLVFFVLLLAKEKPHPAR
jgi:MFS family permease